jgi:hypothetical protein
VVDRADRERGDTEEVVDETTPDEDNGDEGGGGVVLDASYDSEGRLQVNFNNGANSGDVNITVIINGQTVSNTGNQSGDQEGGSSDGADGNDGRDGDEDEEEVGEEPEEEEVEEEELDDRYERRGSRETPERR